MNTTELLQALQWRYATKQFDANKTISSETWDVLEQSLVLTPSSFGLQPWKFIVVKNPVIREKLQAVSWNQPQVTQASHLVVLCAKTDMNQDDIQAYINHQAAVRKVTAESLAPYQGMIEGFTQQMSVEAKLAWNTRQVYIALGQLMTSAATIGLDTCPLEGIDAGAYNTILNLNGSGYTTAVACALGYRDANDKYAELAKVRFSREKIIESI